jgi:hypothetical protein
LKQGKERVRLTESDQQGLQFSPAPLWNDAAYRKIKSRAIADLKAVCSALNLSFAKKRQGKVFAYQIMKKGKAASLNRKPSTFRERVALRKEQKKAEKQQGISARAKHREKLSVDYDRAVRNQHRTEVQAKLEKLVAERKKNREGQKEKIKEMRESGEYVKTGKFKVGLLGTTSDKWAVA